MKCRICGDSLELFLNLGKQPLPNGFLKQPNQHQEKWPLNVFFCSTCKMVQIVHDVPYDMMFRDYFYVTPDARSIQENYRQFSDEIEGMKSLEGAFVIDIGSNIGVLLGNFKSRGAITLGVDPAANIAKLANERGIETIPDYFSERIALEILHERGRADIITVTQALSQIDDLNDLVSGVSKLLKDDGMFVIEVPYLADLVKNLEFDTIHFEHNYYFSLLSLSFLLDRYGMEIFDVKKRDIHGGSIRVYVKKRYGPPVSSSLGDFIDEEFKMGLDRPETYRQFARDVQNLRETITSSLGQLKRSGNSIGAYGASAKGTVLLNYCDLGRDIIDFIVDKNPMKQGYYSPGKGIPVVAHEHLDDAQPDYVLVLAWNFFGDIKESSRNYASKGGKFLHPLQLM